VAAANTIFGDIGTKVIAIMIMISTFGCNNGLILAGARVYYTMANDGLFFKKAGSLNRNAVPGWALWAQCLVAAILCLSGKYSDLLDMIWSVPEVIAALSRLVELQPGDLIFTGTPEGVAEVKRGDELEAMISGLPPLRVRVV